MSKVNSIIDLELFIQEIDSFPWNWALYMDKVVLEWNDKCRCAVLDPDDYEDDADENSFAIQSDLEYKIEVSDVKSILSNLDMQIKNATRSQYYEAIQHYLENDAFLVVGP